MKTALEIITSAVLMTVLFFGCPGCTQDQVDKIDKAATDANTIGSAIDDIASGPAGDLLPPGVTAAVKGAAGAAAVAFGVWQQMRGRVLKQTGSALVAAVEGLPSEHQKQVKAAVKAEMKDREIYSKANAVVDKLKAS